MNTAVLFVRPPLQGICSAQARQFLALQQEAEDNARGTDAADGHEGTKDPSEYPVALELPARCVHIR
jgi:hypothetical protein